MGFSFAGLLPMILFILYGVIILLVITSLYLFIKLALRAIQALDIHLDEKRNRRL
ncbi:hypothetical protein FHS15_004115 [Paenibacillus castaneae]|nr:hypothetical protein [Paenibacillus castaneae]